MIERSKTCTNPECGKTFPATIVFFNKDSQKKDGLRPRCKLCSRAEGVIQRANADPALVKTYNVAYRAANPEKCAANLKAWRRKNPLHKSWEAMLARCSNPNNIGWAQYGGANPPVVVCARWLGENGYENFIADMGPKPTPKHTLSRYLDSGNYEPGNVEWATMTQQARSAWARRQY